MSSVWPLLSTPAIAELARLPRWVCWQHRADRRTGKLTKRPLTPAGSSASTTEPRSWASYAECWAAAYVDGRHDGIGRVLVAGDELVGIDLDDACALDGLRPWANEFVQSLPSYWERSPSGAGLHSWSRGTWPTPGNKRGKVEVYASRRFLTVTGDQLDGAPETIERCDPGVAELWASRFRDRPGSSPSARGAIIADPMSAAELARLARTRPQLRRILERDYPSLSERDLALSAASPSCSAGRQSAPGPSSSPSAATARQPAPTTAMPPSAGSTRHDRRQHPD